MDEGDGFRSGSAPGNPRADSQAAVPPGLPDWCGESLGAVAAGVAGLAGAELWRLTDAQLRDSLEAATRLAASLDGVRLQLVGEVDRRPQAVPGAAPGRGAATFLVQRLNCSPRAAARDAAAARDLLPGQGLDGQPTPARLPKLARALAAGEVTREHVDVAVGCLQQIPTRLVREHLEAIDEHFTDWSVQFCPSGTRRLAARVLAVIDPLGAERADREAFERRQLRRCTDSTGMLIGSFQLDPASAAVVAAALDRYSKPDTGTAQVRPPGSAGRSSGDEGTAEGASEPVLDRRTKAQRDADALVAIAQHALNANAHPAPAPVQVLVLATPQQLVAAGQGRAAGPAADGPLLVEPGAGPRAAHNEALESEPPPGLASTPQGPISPATLGRLSCDASLQRILLAPSGAVLNLGRRTRLATRAQRAALAARDQGCVIPGCAVVPHACDAHHIVSWHAGGSTDLANLALLCPRHHSAVHHGHWRLEQRDGAVWVTPPRWYDPRQQPLRNTTHQAEHQAHQLGQRFTDPDPPRLADAA